MLLARIRQPDRAPSARPVSAAALRGHALMFHKRASDGSAKCNVIHSEEAGSTVHGVVFAISEHEIAALHRAEGVGRGYNTTQVRVDSPAETLTAFSYAADPDHVEPALLPYTWYKALVLAGARQHRLPEVYVREIERVKAVPDPDPGRETRARQLLLI